MTKKAIKTFIKVIFCPKDLLAHKIILALLMAGGSLSAAAYTAEAWAPGKDGADPFQCSLPNMLRPFANHAMATGGGAPALVCQSDECDRWTGRHVSDV